MELKIKYYLQHEETGMIISKIYTLKEIEDGLLKGWLDSLPRWFVIGRCQYIGIEDKTGEEVYRGNIVTCEMIHKGGSLPHMGEVVYVNEFGSFATRNLGGETLLHNHLLNTFRVIGNIYDNPELL